MTFGEWLNRETFPETLPAGVENALRACWLAAKAEAAEERERLEAEVERLWAVLKYIAHASPGLGYDYEDLQDLAAEALDLTAPDAEGGTEVEPMYGPIDADLLACPFCGSDDIDAKGWLAGDGTHGPQCMSCGATGPSIDGWNKRASEVGGDGWRSIESAPADETVVLLAWWDGPNEGWQYTVRPYSNLDIERQGEGYVRGWATHWRPLSPPPADTEGV